MQFALLVWLPGVIFLNYTLAVCADVSPVVMSAHAPCVRQWYDPGPPPPPPPCVALGVRDLAGQWQLALIVLHRQRRPPKGPQEAAYTPKAISDRLGKGVDSSLTNGSRLYTCESKYRQAYTVRTEHYDMLNDP